METTEALLTDLREALGASRVTLRVPTSDPGQPFPVVAESLAPGVGSIRDERSVHLPTQPVVLEISQGRQVVQDDCASAYDDPAFHAMLAAYGGLAAQIVTPIMREDAVAGIVSVHQLGEPRAWTSDEISICTQAVAEIGGRL